MESGGLQVITNKEFYHFFRNNLEIENPEIADYVAGLMVRFADRQKLSVLFDERADTEKFDAMWKSQYRSLAYRGFADLGDAYMWLCAFCPSYVSKKRRASLGMENYADTGQEAYYNAVTVGNKLKGINPKVRTLYRLGRDFREIVRSIFDLRRRADISVVLTSPDVLTEMGETFYGGRLAPVYKLKEKPLLIPV